MGQELSLYFDRAEKLGGLKAKMRLIILTGVVSKKAEKLEDNLINTENFKNAFKELEKEYK